MVSELCIMYAIKIFFPYTSEIQHVGKDTNRIHNIQLKGHNSHSRVGKYIIIHNIFQSQILVTTHNSHSPTTY